MYIHNSCFNCAYSIVFDGRTECRKNPPGEDGFAKVSSFDWCGQHERSGVIPEELLEWLKENQYSVRIKNGAVACRPAPPMMVSSDMRKLKCQIVEILTGRPGPTG